jgi:peptidoglycan/LPS O-acetylase OafA/YrhL
MNKFHRPELDVLRFCAFLMVFTFHAAASVGGPKVTKIGTYGVDLFFVLSAYLITELFRRERARTGAIAVGAFYRRRILRIWPLYYAFTAVVFAASFVVRSIQMPTEATIALLVFGANWYLAAGGPFFSPAGILWSVSVEEQFYVVAPWLMRWLTARALAALMVVLLVAAAATRLAWPGGGWYGTLTRLDPITAGVLLALALDGRVPALRLPWRLLLGTGGILAFWLAAEPLGEANPLAGTVATVGALLLFLAALGATRAPAPLIYLGRISYGLYVFHLLFLDVAKVGLVAATGHCPWWLRGALALPVTVALAAGSYRWLELPFLRLKDTRQDHGSKLPANAIPR